MATYYTIHDASVDTKVSLPFGRVMAYGGLLAAMCASALLLTDSVASTQFSIAVPSFVGRASGFIRGASSQGAEVTSRIQDLSLAAASVDAPLSLDTLSSRVDRPIVIPSGVKLSRENGILTVQGPKGALSRPIPDEVKLREENSILLVTYESDERKAKAMFGLYRALINNMVVGVSQEFVKKMEMIGVGYRGRVEGATLVLAVGKSHDVVLPIPDGVKVVVEDNIRIVVSGVSNEAVGQFCADVRKERPPEPYKGKGIRYLGEKIILKVGKGGKGKK